MCIRDRYKGKETEFHNTREAQDAGVVIVHQELNMIGDLTVAQNIFCLLYTSRCV